QVRGPRNSIAWLSRGKRGLRAGGLLAVLDGLGCDDSLAFGAELDPGLNGLLALSGGGRVHRAVPWPGGFDTSSACAMFTLNTTTLVIKISIIFCNCNG